MKRLLWTVRFDPQLHPGSTLLTVTRPAANVWTIEAGPNDIGGLTSATTSGKSVKLNEGYFRMPFKITLDEVATKETTKMVRFNRRVLGALVLAGCLSNALIAGKPAADIPLLLSFSNTEADALTSDGALAFGSDADYAHGVENVLAIIQPSGNFRFTTQNDLRAPAPRRMCVDFGSQLDGQGVPFTGGNPRQCVKVMQPMHAYLTGDVSIASLRYGQSVEKLTRFEWDDASYRYRVGYGTDLDRDGVIDSPSVRVTCTAPAVSSAACTTWVLAPSTDGAAVLYRFKIQKSGSVQEDTGDLVANVVMPFAQTFTRK